MPYDKEPAESSNRFAAGTKEDTFCFAAPALAEGVTTGGGQWWWSVVVRVAKKVSAKVSINSTEYQLKKAPH